ncbi:VWA domain-containing protein [Epidermidibacterium keratini]|uniref:VWA domain-containing protein n=1 Tax=Epidermidibacterium keratini TaxID=1891644 RepID=A0A7L4YQ72_9ACTN|nr:VWA domain-containing protein [Epidermidibacterium keratini]QHC01421.1 VWA domain-containing protein [Epidermidibacterium keratini]
MLSKVFSRGSRRLIGVLAAATAPVLLTLPGFVPAAHAAPTAPKIMLVMDASGSMAGAADDGTPKIDAAKSALNAVVDEIPDNVEVGFRVFGAAADPGTPEACTDSQLTAPLAAGNRDALKGAISSYTPKGETPISYALEQAAADLGSDGPRSIILVSDGVATCAPDPCEVASQITASGIDVRLDVIGLGVAADQTAQQQLQCVASAGGGQYYDATTQEELGASLSKLAERASHPFEITGEPVAGTPTIAGAPTIEYGTWVDSIGLPGTVDATKFYRVKRTIPGSTLHITASMKGGDDDSLKLRAANDDFSDFKIGPSAKTGLLTASVTLDPRLDSTGKGEKAMGEYVDIAIDRSISGDAIATDLLPVQVIVVEEPPVDGVKGLPQPQEDNYSDKTTGTFVEPVDSPAYESKSQRALGGRSMADAQEVSSGRYEGTIAPGDVQVYKVPLLFGQFLSTTTSFPANGEVLKEQIQDGNVKANVGVYDSAMRYATLGIVDGSGVTSGYANDSELDAQTSQVRYLNRTGLSDNLSYIGGYYYIVLSVTPSELGDTFVVPFTMDIGVQGEADGVPEYTEKAPQEIGVPQPASAEGASSEPSSGSSSKPIWIAAAAVGGLVCLGGAWWLLRRRAS